MSNMALNSIAERQRYPASMADKQSSFPERNAALRHILIQNGFSDPIGYVIVAQDARDIKMCVCI